jgi:hypothetical protein
MNLPSPTDLNRDTLMSLILTELNRLRGSDIAYPHLANSIGLAIGMAEDLVLADVSGMNYCTITLRTSSMSLTN